MGLWKFNTMFNSQTSWIIFVICCVSGAFFLRPHIIGVLINPVHEDAPIHTPLIKAVSYTNSAEVAYLLSTGVDPNVKTEAGNSALFYGCQGTNVPQSRGIVTMLLDYYADPRIANKNGETALMFLQNISDVQTRMEMMGDLIVHGADINSRIHQGYTLLYRTVETMYMMAVGAMFDWFGMLLDSYSIQQSRARALNIGYTYIEDMNRFLDQRIPTPTSLGIDWVSKETGLNALMFAVLKGDLKSVTDLVNKGAAVNKSSAQPISKMGSFGYTALHLAVVKGDMAIVEYLLSKGADPNSVARNGNYPIHMILYFDPKSNGINETIMINLVNILIAKGARLNAQNSRKETILHVAVQRGYTQLIKNILDRYKNMLSAPLLRDLILLAKKWSRPEVERMVSALQ